MTIESTIRNGLIAAFCLNFIWINLSEIARYFLVVRPMLQDAFPGQAEIAPMSLGIFALWGIWDLILIGSATGFYWIWTEKFGGETRQIVIASLAFTVTIFGLIWLGVANMGLAPYSMLAAALPLAWIEQAMACWIVVFARKRAYSSASMRSM